MGADPSLRWLCAVPLTVDILDSRAADIQPAAAIDCPADTSTFGRCALHLWKSRPCSRRTRPFWPGLAPSACLPETRALRHPCQAIDRQHGRRENDDLLFERPCSTR